MKSFVSFLLAMLFFGSTATAQGLDSSGYRSNIFFKETPSSFQSYVKPALYSAGAIAITAALIRTDQNTYRWLYHWKKSNHTVGEISPWVTQLGDGKTSVLLFGGLLGCSYLTNDKKMRRAGEVGLESFFVSGIATQVMKHMFSRERPSVSTRDGGHWNGQFSFLNHNPSRKRGVAHFDAFPSGHTATAFAAATALSEVYGDSPWIHYTSYGLASAVALSRVTERTHWFSDCFVGALVGYFSAKLVIQLNESERNFSITPFADSKQIGIALSVGI